MSTYLTGHAPSMFNQTFANVSSLTDQVAIGYLLNYTNSTGYNNFEAVDLLSHTNDLIYTQVANKSLIITNNVEQNVTATPNITQLDITVANATFIDEFGFNAGGSNVYVQETFQINVTSPDSGVIYGNNTSYQISLNQVAVSSQNDLSALNYMRILNQTGNVATSVAYNASNIDNALGQVEGVVYFYNNQTGFNSTYKSISGYTNMSAGYNMSYTVLPSLNTTSATISSYVYELVNIGWQDPTFNITSSTNVTTGNVNNVVSLFGTTNTYSQLNAALSYTYEDFLGSLNYTGSMGNNISGVGTSSLAFTFTNAGNPTQAFTFVSGDSNALQFPATFVSINNLTNATQIANATYGDQLTVSITPSTIVYDVTASSVNPVPAGITTVIVGESLPSNTDHSLDNITLVMNTTQRALVTSSYSFSNVTVVYPNDATNYNIGELSGAQLTTIPYSYDCYMMAPPSYNYNDQFVNPGAGNTTAYSAGLYAIYSTSDSMSLSNVTITNTTVAMMGALYHTSNDVVANNTSVGPADHLLYVLNSNYQAVYNQTATINDLCLESNTLLNNSTAYSLLDITGLALSDVDGAGYYMNASTATYWAQNGLRVLLQPTDPLGANATCTSSIIPGSGITMTNNTPYIKYGAYGSTSAKAYALSYNSSYDFGPITANNYSGKNYYKQTYTIEFVGGLTNPQTARKVTVVGSSSDTTGPSAVWTEDGTKEFYFGTNAASTNPTYKYYTTQKTLVNPGVSKTYYFDMSMDVMLPGVKQFDPLNEYGSQPNHGTASIYIPGIVMTVPSTGTAVAPKLVIELQLAQNGTFTHIARLQGLVSGYGWGPFPNANAWYIDTRYTTPTLEFYNKGSVANSDYYVAVGLYPGLADTVSLPYSHPLNIIPQTWTGVYWDLINNSSARNFMSSNAPAFTVDNFFNMLDSPSSGKVYMDAGSVTYDVTTELISVDLSNVTALAYGGTFAFDVDLNGVISAAPVYFAYSRGVSIVGVPYPDNNNNNFALSSGDTVQPQTNGGVAFSSSQFSASTGLTLGSYGSVELLPNWYYATAWSGQTGYHYNSPGQYIGYYPLVDGVYPLIPTSEGGYTTCGVNSAYARGYQNFTAVWDRTGVTMNATFGQYSLSDVVIPSGTNVLTLDFTPTGPNAGMANGIKFNYVATTDQINNVYNVNKTVVSGVYNPVTGSAINMAPASSPSGLLMNQLVNNADPTHVPWIEEFALNNFFVSGSSLTVNYNQDPVTINTAAYNSTNDAISANTYVANASYTTQQSVSDSSLISSLFSLTQDSVQFIFNSGVSQMLRQYGQQFYVDVAPLDAVISLTTSNSNVINGSTAVATRKIVMEENLPIEIDVDGVTAYYTFSSTMVPINFVNSNVTNDYFNFKPNLYMLRGSQLPGVYYTYFYTYQDLTNWTEPDVQLSGPVNGVYTMSFVQYGQSSPNLIKLTLNSDKMLPLYTNSGWWNGITVTPPNASRMTTYELSFAMNTTTKLLAPSVTKYTSGLYAANSNIVNPVCESANVLTSSLANISTYPYQVPTSTALLYPSPSTNTAATPTWSSITPPTFMNTAIKVIGDPSANTFYNNLFNIAVGDYTTAKVNTVFAADQLAVTNYAGGLLMRVGPDGHLYSGDVSTYSIAVVDNQQSIVAPINGVRVPIYNSDVNLSA